MSDEEDALGEIYPAPPKMAMLESLRTDFQPWHKPRKHYVRLKQWCHETDRLIKKLGLARDDELRYLGLPGEDLLDVLTLRDICGKSQIKLRYIGFDSGSGRTSTLNVASHKVNSNGFIHSASVILPDQLGAILNKNSLAYAVTEKNAPYDVINLDFCNSIFRNTSDVFPNMDVVRAICDVQSQRRALPWVFFVTFRVIRPPSEVLPKMFHHVRENIASYDAFYKAVTETLTVDAGAIQRTVDGVEFSDSEWANCHNLAFSKWFLSYLLSLGCRVSLRPSFVYNVLKRRKDMASLAFLVEPETKNGSDSSGITTNSENVELSLPNEVDQACQMVDAISKMVDLDERLASEPELYEKFAAKNEVLLAGVGYDPVEYRSWVSENGPETTI